MTDTVLLALDTSTEFCSVALLSAPAFDASRTSDASHAAASTGAAGTTAATATTDAWAAPGTATEGGTTGGTPLAPVAPRIWSRHEATGAVSSTRLLPAIRELFDEAGLALDACSAIAFGAGPGSFTGLRTATGVAQGLAFGLNLPVVPVGTLLACAERARQRDPSTLRVLAALDARMDEVYWADYAWDDAVGEWHTVQPASLDAPERLALPDAPFTLAGNAAAAFGARLPAALRAARIDADALPHAVPVALVALRAWRAGRTVPADQAAPEYVRNKVAQTVAEREAAKAAAGNAR